MKKILSLICAAAVLILFVAACAVKPDNFIAPAQLYYSVGEYTYHQEDGVIRSETRETKLFNSDLKLFLNAYLAGPVSKKLISPFPSGAQVVDVTQSEKEITIVLNETFSKLSGIDLTLPISCLSMTILEYTGGDTVRFRVENGTLSGKEVITVTRDLLLFKDDTALKQEDT
jgi:hypothetical protein